MQIKPALRFLFLNENISFSLSLGRFQSWRVASVLQTPLRLRGGREWQKILWKLRLPDTSNQHILHHFWSKQMSKFGLSSRRKNTVLKEKSDVLRFFHPGDPGAVSWVRRKDAISAWKLSSRCLFKRPDYLPLGLRGWFFFFRRNTLPMHL